jgi:tetratricopeptide (TPR) repeat protein
MLFRALITHWRYSLDDSMRLVIVTGALVLLVLAPGRELLGSMLDNNLAWLDLLKGAEDEAALVNNYYSLCLNRPATGELQRPPVACGDLVNRCECTRTCYSQLRFAARVYLIRYESARAEPVLRCLLRLDPEDQISLWQLGMIILDTGNIEEVVSLWRGKPPADWAAALCKKAFGNAIVSGDWEPARTLCDLAASVKPDSARVWYLVGRVATELKDRDKALAAFLKAYELDPAPDTSLQTYLGWALYAKGEYQEAIEIMRKVLSEQPTNGSALTVAGLSLQASGNKEDALAYLKKRVDTVEAGSTSAAFAYYNYGRLLLDLGDLPMAEEYCRRSLDNSYSSEDLVNLSKVCLDTVRQRQQGNSNSNGATK